MDMSSMGGDGQAQLMAQLLRQHAQPAQGQQPAPAAGALQQIMAQMAANQWQNKLGALGAIQPGMMGGAQMPNYAGPDVGQLTNNA
jgi:hypothetical protein